MQTFSILGTGWLGYALALKLKKNYKVKVSVRSEEKKESLINDDLYPYLLNEENVCSLDELLDTDYLFINFPPSKFENYISFLNKIYSNEKIKKIKKIIFVSSTSIYPKVSGVFTEESEIKSSSSQKVFDAEELVKNKTDVIFRCSGLMGYNRVAGRYFSSKSLDSEDVKVNYVHRDDIIEATTFVIENNINGVFNLCGSSHPTRKEIYLTNAKKYGFEAPIFENKKEYVDRVIDGSKIEELGFRYKYPNPLEY